MPPSKKWFSLFVLFGINTMNFYDRQIIGAVAEPIRKEWGMSDTQMGILGTAFILMYAVVGLPLGRLADKYSRKKILGYGVGVWSVLTACSGLVSGYTTLFITRLGVGVGEASCAPAANSLIGDLFPPRQRATALSVFMLGLPIGLFLSYRFSGMIAQAFSWREAFYFACIPGLILAALAFFIPEPVRGASEGNAVASRARPGSPFWVVLAIPTMLWIIVSGALHNFNMYAMNSFFPAFLMRVHHLPLKEATTFSGIVLGAVGIVGLLAGGWLADKLSAKRKDGKLLLSAITMFIAAPCIFFALSAGDTGTIMLLMGVGSMMMYVYYSCVYASIQDVIEPALRGTAMALYFFAMYLLGASLGPVLMGVLSDRFAHQAMSAAGATEMTEAFKAAGLNTALYIVPILCAILSIVLYAASRSVKRDRERLEEWMRG